MFSIRPKNKVVIKYKDTTISVNYHSLLYYSNVLLSNKRENPRDNMYLLNKKYIHKKIREELDRMYQQKQERSNVSQYVEYWLAEETRTMLYKIYERCEERNKNQRESLKEKYSIIEKDKLIEKISCLENIIDAYKYPKRTKEQIEKYNKDYDENLTYKELVNKECG